MKKIFIAALSDEVIELDYFYISGVGKINATIKTLNLINEFKPNQIINFGTAGAINPDISGIIECTKFYQRDMDCRGLMEFKLGQTPFDNINEISFSEEGYRCGTGDSFVKSKIEIKVDIVDMEAYAIAKVCLLNNVNFRCFKFISDKADENANISWEENLKLGAKKFEELRKKIFL